MSRETYEILPGALLISDAHYGAKRPGLLSLLRAIHEGMLRPPQLVLMGDIFDLLFGQIPLTQRMNAEAVALIQKISRAIPVLYLEGNHDFNLSGLFPDAHVVPLKRQPLRCRCGSVNMQLAHGDFNQPLLYRIYTAIIRNPFVLKVLGAINAVTANAIIGRLEAYLEQKNDCYVIAQYESMVHAHLGSVDLDGTDAFIEGHYHQGRAFDVRGVRYINPSAFACNLHYAMVSLARGSVVLHEKTWKG